MQITMRLDSDQRRIFVLGATAPLAGLACKPCSRAMMSSASCDPARESAERSPQATARSCSRGRQSGSRHYRSSVLGERRNSRRAFDALVRVCLAHRCAADAWAVDYQAHVHALEAGRKRCGHMLLLSAICVQKRNSRFNLPSWPSRNAAGIRNAYTIIRPTAFFKSLCGQSSDQAGKPFLVSETVRSHRASDQRQRPRRLHRRLPER